MEILIDTIFVKFGGRIFQPVGISTDFQPCFVFDHYSFIRMKQNSSLKGISRKTRKKPAAVL